MIFFEFFFITAGFICYATLARSFYGVCALKFTPPYILILINVVTSKLLYIWMAFQHDYHDLIRY